MEVNELINRISFIRTRANLSARKLSLAIGKTPGYIHRLENARDFAPAFETLVDILDVCNTLIEEFFYCDIYQYQTDKEALNFFKSLSKKQKEAILNLYN